MKWVSEGADMEACGRGCVQCRDRNLKDRALDCTLCGTNTFARS